MSLCGTLQDLPLPDLLQMIAANRKTGRLILTRRDGHGVIAFRNGKIIYAASNSVRETLGNILLHERLISESTLLAALERQSRSPEEKRLGPVLVEMGALDEPTIERIVRAQTQRVIQEFLRWNTGFAKFEVLQIPDRGEVEVDARDFLMQAGFNADELLLGILGRLDPRDIDTAELDMSQVLRRAPWVGGPAAAEAGPPEPQPASFASLKSIMAEIRSPAFTAEVSLGILRYAARSFARGVLFARAYDGFHGMGQFGIGTTSGSIPVREIRIPVDEPSLFLEVSERKESYRGPLADGYWNVHLGRQLGGPVPQEVAAIPMIVDARVVLIFYGDNVPGNAPIGPIDDLELLMIEGGLVIEKSLLESRLKAFDERRSQA
ncbi:MAG TPA: DUF4388 domain-containing protein [Thermoanaerobaculia bacterium]|nr:DUF4388 domain-containing protein [Thermoanaerobaculia bacterium]